jgi:hypothetical protein
MKRRESEAAVRVLHMLIGLALVGAIMASVSIIAARFAHGGEQKTFFDRNGSYQGSAITHGNSTSFRDRNGAFNGSSIQHGNSTTYYDKNGHFIGSTTNRGNPK